MYVGVNRKVAYFGMAYLVFPMYVGVNRRHCMVSVWHGMFSIPHVCGGEPSSLHRRHCSYRRIPHVCGGEPSIPVAAGYAMQVFPMYVGVNRMYWISGDRLLRYSPCMWG